MRRLDEICEIIMGQSPPGATYNDHGDGLPFFQGKAEFGDLYPRAKKWCSEPKKIALPDDILISVRAPVGPTNLCPSRACIGRGLAAIRPKDGVSTRYLLYAMRATIGALLDKATGSTFDAVSGNDLRAHLVPIVPLADQDRIVGEIEKQFSRLDAGVAALKRVQANLKRYRASVLKAAYEGRLVPTEAELARQEGRDYETGEHLLQRILEDRRKSWIGKGQFRAPANADASTLPALPAGWTWTTVAQMAAPESNAITDGPFGSNLKTEHYTASGPRVIRLQNIGDGMYIDARAHISLEHFTRLQKHRVLAHDIVIAGLGENPPRSCIIPEGLGPAIVKADCIRFKPHPGVSPEFVNAALNAEPTRRRLRDAVHGVGRPRLNLTEIKAIELPLPPFAEQCRIVAEIKRRLSFVEDLNANIMTGQIRAIQLKQAILEQQFGTHAAGPKGDPWNKDGDETNATSIGQGVEIVNSYNVAVADLFELTSRIKEAGGSVLTTDLLNMAGLTKDVDRFFELLREGRDTGILRVPLGADSLITVVDLAD